MVLKTSQPTIIIFGISSFIGSNLAEFLKKHYRVIGTYYSKKILIEGVLTVPCDVLNREQVQLMVYRFKPNFSIYAIGLTSLELCYKHPKLADALNTVGVFNVTEYSERYGSKMCLISTAYVFNGANKELHEGDTPDPNTMYGKTKAAAEFYIQKQCLNYLIIRTCNVYGRSINSRERTFFEMIQLKMLQEKLMVIDNNVIEGYIDVLYLALVIRMCFERNITNRLFQLSSKDYLTRFDFVKLYCKYFNGNDGLVQRGAWQFYQMEGYPGSSKGLWYKMDIFNLESYLGVELPTIDESLSFTFQRLGGNLNNSKVKEKSSEGIKYI